MRLVAEEARRRLARFTWETDPRAQSHAMAFGIRFFRIATVISRDIARGELRLQAAGLVYATLLALIPLLAVVFSILKGFGLHDLLRPTLLNLLAPLGQTGVELTRQILEFVTRMRVGVLGAIGFALLLYTSVSLVRRVEQALNGIWQVRQARRLIRRLSDYFAVIVIGPLLFFLAVGVTASLSASGWFKPLHGVITFGATLIPYLLIIGAHALLYIFVPNTKVRLRSALIGAAVAGVLWQSVGSIFAAVITGSVQYRAVYASLAILIIFMIWVYISWLIVLIGASIAHYHQHPERVARESSAVAAMLSIRRKERLGLLIARHIGAHYYAGRQPWTADALARALQQPVIVVESVLAAYVAADLLARTQASPFGYLPMRPIETVMLSELLRAVRTADVDRDSVAADAPVDEVIAAIDAATERALAGRTWRDLALAKTPMMTDAPETKVASTVGKGG
jgi:membrane protein